MSNTGQPDSSPGDDEAVEAALTDLVSALESDFHSAVSRNALPSDETHDVETTAPAESFGNYRIESRLGRGGMGEVYIAEDTRLRRQVALKLLTRRFTESSDWRRRFFAEARTVASLNHPGICVIYEAGETDKGIPFIAMELVVGDTLKVYARERDLDISSVAELGIQIADALAGAHEKGIVHRDIKPDNIMITDSGAVKVLDFGLAKRLINLPPESNQDLLVRTAPGHVAGTPLYMSPEQAIGDPIDHRSDIFSLGVVLYELLTGRPPFVGSTIEDTLHRIAHADPPPLTDSDRDVPEPLEEVLRRCVAKDRTQRFDSAAEVRDTLRAIRRALGQSGGDSNSPLQRAEDDAQLPTPSPEVIRGSDILINCAMFDDIPFSEQQSGWVSEFQRHLEIRLKQLWGAPVKIARTMNPAGDSPIADRMNEYVSDVKTMVSVVSPPFVKSDGCRIQVEEFCKAAEESGGLWAGDKARLLKVVKVPADLRRAAPDLAELFDRLQSFDFFEIDASTGRFREYDGYFDSTARQRFFERVYDLAQELCVTLESYASGIPSTRIVPSGKTIYLAETTADLYEARDELRRELQEQGHVVLPAHPLPLRVGDLEAAVREYLRRSDVCIHLLGDRYGLVPEGAKDSIVELQHRWSKERAREGRIARYAWMPPALRPVEDRQARFLGELQQDPEVAETTEIVCGVLQSLKRLLHARFEPRSLPVLAHGESKPGTAPPVLYLICDRSDEAEASRLQDWLFERGIEVSLPDFEVSESEFASTHRELLTHADAVMIYYGKVRRSWVEAKLRDLMKAAGFGRSAPFTAKTVYVAPGEDLQRQRFKTHLAVPIQARSSVDEDVLRPFVDLLASRTRGGA